MNKKLALLLALLAIMVVGAASSASAADLKATGTWMIESSWRNMDFNKQTDENNFSIAQRMRTQFQFIANENLKAVLGTQIGTDNWGSGMYQIGSGRAASATTNRGVNANAANAGNIMLYSGYLDFKLPGTKINALVGYMPVSLPAAFGGGSAILDDQMGAAVVVAPITDNIKVLAGYARLVDVNTVNTAATAKGGGGNVDAVFAALPIDFKGYNITPFAAYATAGKYSTADSLAGLGNNATTGATSGTAATGAKIYWGGAAFTMTAFDPFKLMADFNYGSAKYKNDPKYANGGGREGYMYDIALDYTGLSMMTPEAFFVYSSGEKHANSSDGKSNRLPVVASQNWAVGSFFFQGDSMMIGSLNDTTSTLGFWAAGVSLKDIKLVDKLSHTANVIYFKGTNAAETVTSINGLGAAKSYGHYLTTKDSLWEFDLNNKYMIYDELALNLDLGYLATSFNKSLWAPVVGGSQSNLSKDAYKVNLGLVYSF